MSSKKTEQTQSNQATQFQYDPQGMQGYGASVNYLTNLLNRPFQDPAFSLERGMINNQALNLGQRYISSLTNNINNSGFGSQMMPGFMQSQLARGGRYTGQLQSQGLLQAMLNATQRQFAASQILQRPLQTGATSQGQSTSTQTQSGGFLGPILTGGLSLLGGGAFGGGGLGSVPPLIGGGFGGQGVPYSMAGIGSPLAGSSYWNPLLNPMGNYIPGVNTNNSTNTNYPFQFSPYSLGSGGGH